jgi:ADP-heptose:LPS heptosyltransferase
MEKYVVFHVEGGLGKNVASTAVIKNIAEKHKDRKLIVMASFPEIFLNNPYVHRAFRMGMTPYFWEDYISGKDTIVLKREPYFETNHIMQKTPLHETWHKMYDLPYNKEKDLPELFNNMIQTEMSATWKRQRPILLLHTNGGPLMDGAPIYAWTRDMPRYVAETIIQNYAQQYHIIQVVKHESQAIQSPMVEVVHRAMSNMELFSLVRASAKRVLIDSCLQHAAAAFKLPSTVLWVGTHPEMFGYSMHTNVKAKKPTGNVKNIDGSYFDYQLDGQFHECPYNTPDEIFDINEVLKAINKA